MGMYDIAETIATVVPEKCQQCPVQCGEVRSLGRLLVLKQSMDFAAEGLVGESGAEYDQYVDLTMPSDQAEEMKRFVRQHTGNSLETLDRAIESKEAEIAAYSLSCTGPLNMRAKKDGVTYTAAICTSAKVYTRGGQDHVPVHIKTEQK